MLATGWNGFLKITFWPGNSMFRAGAAGKNPDPMDIHGPGCHGNIQTSSKLKRNE
jgi:hypothetical protein